MYVTEEEATNKFCPYKLGDIGQCIGKNCMAFVFSHPIIEYKDEEVVFEEKVYYCGLAHKGR